MFWSSRKQNNVGPEESRVETFCESYGLKSLVKVLACCGSPQNPSCVDLILTNSPLSFRGSGVIETEFSVIVMKATFQKLDPEIIHYRDFRKYCNCSFMQDLLSTLVMENINFSNGLQKSIDICMKTLDKFAPRKNKYSRGSNMPFMNKSLSRVQVERTRLRNWYLKKRSEQNRLSYVKGALSGLR